MILVGLAIPAATAIPATASTAPTQGVDVSSLQHLYNPSINWADVAAAGKTFVGIKVTEGNYYTNPYYAGNVAKHYESDVQQATAAGLHVTPYVFANPYPGNGTAAGQADYAAKVIKSVASPAYASSALMLPLTVDLEPDPYAGSEPNGNQCYGLTQSAMVTWIAQFLAEAKAKTAKTPIIYTAANWWDACTGNSKAFSGYPLWLASYGVTNPALPSGWNNVTFWQYTSGGTVNGIAGGTDLDYLGPVLQVSQAGKQIGPVQLRTLNSLNGKPVSYTPTTVLPGLTVNSAGQITGTPSTIGSYRVTVTPSSAGAVPASMTFTWDVHGTLTVNSPGNRTTIVGTPVGLRVTASDQDTGSPVSFAASGLPAGLSMNSSGLITGWPSKPGTFKVTVSASDGLYASGSMSFTWTVKAASGSGVTGAIRQVGGSGRCLDDPYSKTANGTHVDLWNCNGHSNQQWTVVQDGTIRVLGKCLDVVGGNMVNGAKLQLWSCISGNGAQQWQAGSDGELVNPQSGKCLDVPVSSAANGTQPVLESCANVANQHWLRPAAAVVSGEPGKCLAASGAAVQLAGCANVAAQHWMAEPDGTFRLSGMCLTEGAATAGSGLSIGSCNGAAATKWKLIPAGPIATEVASTASGLCVTIPSSGTALVIESCAPTPAATWQVE
jgi:GH25 family lysozyme M1 (1,4-beta-N-acetylmuramidase)